jgi:ABC-2 type transport system permease protein
LSTTITQTAQNVPEHHTISGQKPSFFGLIGGELFKVTRMWSIWISLVLMLGGMCLPFLITLTVNSQKDS